MQADLARVLAEQAENMASTSGDLPVGYTDEQNTDESKGLRIAAVFIVLSAGLLGGIPPLMMKVCEGLGMTAVVLPESIIDRHCMGVFSNAAHVSNKQAMAVAAQALHYSNAGNPRTRITTQHFSLLCVLRALAVHSQAQRGT